MDKSSEIKSVGENRREEVLSIANKVMKREIDGLVIVFKVGDKGDAELIEGITMVNNVSRTTQLRVLQESLNIESQDLMAMTLGIMSSMKKK